MDLAARSGELLAGLEHFARVWAALDGRLVSKRLEGAIGRMLMCEALEGERVLLHLQRNRIDFDGPEGLLPHATLRLSQADWARVLTGESHLMAIVLAGRAPFPKDQRRLIMQFSMLLQTALLSQQGTAEAREPALEAPGKIARHSPASERASAKLIRPSATRDYARFALDLRYEDIPKDVLDIAREQIVATIGSCYTGSMMPAASSVAAGLAILGAGAQGTLFGSSQRMAPPATALYNSAVAQVIDFDDWVIISHSGAAVIPTTFAAGEAVGASGRDLLTAVVLGNEINARTSRAIQRGSYVGNSMPNHQIETALIASRLFGLDEVQTRRALSHSCFLAMESCNTGWMTDSKVLCNGLPAMWGIVSASLAKAGLVGNVDMIEHPAGYLATVSEVVDLDELLKGLGDEWHTRTLNTKRHPSCAYNLPAIECALSLRARIPDFDPSRVSSIEVDGPGVMLYVAARFQALEPDLYTQIRDNTATHVALCFDAGHGVLASLADGEFTYRQYLSERTLSPVLQSMRERIVFRADPEMHAAYYSHYRYGARVRIRMNDGREYVEERMQLLGAPERPFDHGEKFREGASLFMPEARVDEALATLRALDDVENIRSVMHLFSTED